MNDNEFDPYDISNYSNPINQKAKENNNYNEENNTEESKNSQKVQNVFNPYNDNNEEDGLKGPDEETKLKSSKKKNKRKKTDEGLSENIDLSKNAYEENDSNQKNEENTKNSNEDANEEELPLLEELGINPQNIKNKIIGVITLKKIDKKFLEDSDMAGPLLIFLLFAFSLMLQYKINFGYIYGISLFGSILLFLLLNLMSVNNGILLYNTISVLGYCLIPIVILSFAAVFLDMKNIMGGILCLIAIVLSSLNASRFFEIGLEMYSQRWLIFYPVALFYTCFVLVTIY